MLNTEIGKTGEVTVEGHVIGRLDGFTFLPDAAEAGSDAKALQATALKALAGEIDTRAEKLGNAPDDQFVLASDGIVRWTGDAVARLVAADDVLHPRLRIIADDRLSGAPREAVQTRLDLWLKTHIEKLLGPLFDLTKAEDITGIGRGIAFQLTEALGVLERQKISGEMKDLDQPSRATLRKYGVRFGAYHIYIPGLLKPAGRALAALLWALKQDNVDMSSLSSAQHLAGSGRTSFPVDKLLDRDAYRVLGYRQCGERAVRVDILERLADLIRPALSWRENSPGDKPAGAFDGRHFVVTQAMTSLTGSAGEDFASILRALGYRMEKKAPLPPAPPKPVAATTPIEAAPAETTTTDAAAPDAAAAELSSPEAIAAGAPAVDETSEAAAPEQAAPEQDAAEQAASDQAAPGQDAAEQAVPAQAVSDQAAPEQAISKPAAAEPVPAEAIAAEPEIAAVTADIADITNDAAAEQAIASSASLLPEVSPVSAAAETDASADAAPAVADAEASDATSSDAASSDEVAPVAAEATAAAEPELIEVWRPGGRAEERRPPRHDRNRHRNNAPQGEAVVADGAAAGEGAKRNDRNGPGRRDRNYSEFRRPRSDAPAAAAPAEGAPNREARGDRDNKGGNGRPPRERERFQGKGKGKFQGGDKGGRDGRPNNDRGGATRPFATTAAPRERDRPIDPNSPFAKLAALKDQLTGRKD